MSTTATTTNASDTAHENHNISVRVLRLSKPLLASNQTWRISEHALAMAPALQTTNELDSIFASVEQQKQPFSAQSSPVAPASTTLVLPSSFGNIYLGETLSVGLVMNNDCTLGSLPLQDIGIKAELQTASQRSMLVDTTNAPLPDMPPGTSLEFVLHQDIRELGMHILVVQVSYTFTHNAGSVNMAPASTGGLTAPTSAYKPAGIQADPAASTRSAGVGMSERKLLRKFYKFQVLNPLIVKTRVVSTGIHTLARTGFSHSLSQVPPAAHAYGNVLLEVQLTNAMANGNGMFLTSMTFQPIEGLECLDMSTMPPTSVTAASVDASAARAAGEGGDQTPANRGGPSPAALLDVDAFNTAEAFSKSVFRSAYLNAGDVRQYLYIFRPCAGSDSASAALASNALGKLDITWNTKACEGGKLQTSPLMRKAAPASTDVVIIPAPTAGTPALLAGNFAQPSQSIVYGKPFDVPLRIYNRTGMNLKLQIVFPRANVGATSVAAATTPAAAAAAGTTAPATGATTPARTAAETAQSPADTIARSRRLAIVGANTIVIGDLAKNECSDFSVRCVALSQPAGGALDASAVIAGAGAGDMLSAIYRMPPLKIVESVTGIVREINPQVEVFVVSEGAASGEIPAASPPTVLAPSPTMPPAVVTEVASAHSVDSLTDALHLTTLAENTLSAATLEPSLFAPNSATLRSASTAESGQSEQTIALTPTDSHAPPDSQVLSDTAPPPPPTEPAAAP
ncbi:hypothetical protein RI367_001493 [Sorochytrium milnesiophthora]